MRGAIAIIPLLVILALACDKSVGPPADLRPVAVRIDGPAEVTPPAEVQFTALQTWSDGSVRDVTASAQWTSTNPSVLSVSAGRAEGLGRRRGWTDGTIRAVHQSAPIRACRTLDARMGWYVHADHRWWALQLEPAVSAGAKAADVHRGCPAILIGAGCISPERGRLRRSNPQSSGSLLFHGRQDLCPPYEEGLRH